MAEVAEGTAVVAKAEEVEEAEAAEEVAVPLHRGTQRHRHRQID